MRIYRVDEQYRHGNLFPVNADLYGEIQRLEQEIDDLLPEKIQSDG